MTDAAALSDIRRDFIEKTGLITQAEGLPRIAGRVFGLLVFDGQAVAFGDLATSLQVSRASISTSIRILEERGLIKRLSKPGERQDYFQLAQNPYATMLKGIQNRARTSQDDIRQTIDSLPEGSEARARLTDYAEFYATTDRAIGHALGEMTQAPDTKAGPQPRAAKDQTDVS